MSIRYDVSVYTAGSGGFKWEVHRVKDGVRTLPKSGWEPTARAARREGQGWVRTLQARDARQEASKYNKYTVSPFSGKNYHKNADQCAGDDLPCAICGKAIKGDGHLAMVIDGGASWGDETNDKTDAGWMGEVLVGSGCHKRYRSQG